MWGSFLFVQTGLQKLFFWKFKIKSQRIVWIRSESESLVKLGDIIILHPRGMNLAATCSVAARDRAIASRSNSCVNSIDLELDCNESAKRNQWNISREFRCLVLGSDSRSMLVEVHEPITRLNLESPAGIIPVECQVSDGKVTSVRFTNQPAFVYELDAKVEVAGLGTFRVDVAWGGMTYFIIGAKELGFEIVPDEARDICAVMEQIKTAAAQQIPVTHPIHPEFPGISVGVLAGSVENIAGVKTSKNTVVVSPGRLDRSPCGTGTSARMAVMHARGELEVGERFVHTSIIDSTFDCRIESTTTVGGKDAIVPSIAGQAWITEFSTMVLDPSDPYPSGYR